LAKDCQLPNALEPEEILVDTPADDAIPTDDSSRESIFIEFTEFCVAARKEEANNSFRFRMLMGKRKSPLQFWQVDGAAWPHLSKIAIRLFSMATSSAASERNFSTFGFSTQSYAIPSLLTRS
jgi:hAT family C-terminal dimerisation region